MPGAGLEPARSSYGTQDFKSCVSSDSTTRAKFELIVLDLLHPLAVFMHCIALLRFLGTHILCSSNFTTMGIIKGRAGSPLDFSERLAFACVHEWRRGAESNRRIMVLQTIALPLSNRAKLNHVIRNPCPPVNLGALLTAFQLTSLNVFVSHAFHIYQQEPGSCW